mgnify:CR=1 FL=1|tara:strand:+ start:9156 stop:10178 length:1023 start_codon:yes stop_codon:yes gene_type:complete
MKVGIVNRKNSFSKHWLHYLQSHEMKYVEVAPSTENIEELKELDFLFWHVDHFDHSDFNSSSFIIKELEEHVCTFPSTSELSYFDNKICQIKLFENSGITYPKTEISTSKSKAIQSIGKFEFPFVAKLKRGAGSDNVWLIQNEDQALEFIKQSFSTGFSIFNHKKYLQKRMSKAKSSKSITSGLKGLGGMMKNKRSAKKHPREKGYTLFQEYVPNNGFDIRVVVINGKMAFSAKRHANEGDWTASGSGIATYPDNKIDTDYIRNAFSIANKLNSRCIAIDFIRNKNTGDIFTIEISPFYASYSMEPCSGYWDNRLVWHSDNRDPQWFLMEKILTTFRLNE